MNIFRPKVDKEGIYPLIPRLNNSDKIILEGVFMGYDSATKILEYNNYGISYMTISNSLKKLDFLGMINREKLLKTQGSPLKVSLTERGKNYFNNYIRKNE